MAVVVAVLLDVTQTRAGWEAVLEEVVLVVTVLYHVMAVTMLIILLEIVVVEVMELQIWVVVEVEVLVRRVEMDRLLLEDRVELVG
jgi:hypothetical protein